MLLCILYYVTQVLFDFTVKTNKRLNIYYYPLFCFEIEIDLTEVYIKGFITIMDLLKLPLCSFLFWTYFYLLSPVKTKGYRVELVRLSVRPSVCLSVRPSVCLSVPLDIGYFVYASLVWRSWARAFKFYTHINQGLKSCLVKVLSRSVENCRF